MNIDSFSCLIFYVKKRLIKKFLNRLSTVIDIIKKTWISICEFTNFTRIYANLQYFSNKESRTYVRIYANLL